MDGWDDGVWWRARRGLFMQEGKRPKGLPHLAAIKSSSSRTILEMVLIRCPIYFFLLFFRGVEKEGMRAFCSSRIQ